jgi:hypothetical protein
VLKGILRGRPTGKLMFQLEDVPIARGYGAVDRGSYSAKAPFMLAPHA